MDPPCEANVETKFRIGQLHAWTQTDNKQILEGESKSTVVKYYDGNEFEKRGFYDFENLLT